MNYKYPSHRRRDTYIPTHSGSASRSLVPIHLFMTPPSVVIYVRNCEMTGIVEARQLISIDPRPNR